MQNLLSTLKSITQVNLGLNEIKLLVHISDPDDSAAEKSLSQIQMDSRIPYASFYRALNSLVDLGVISIQSSGLDARIRNIQVNQERLAEIFGNNDASQ